jgi:hypothetical protein
MDRIDHTVAQRASEQVSKQDYIEWKSASGRVDVDFGLFSYVRGPLTTNSVRGLSKQHLKLFSEPVPSSSSRIHSLFVFRMPKKDNELFRVMKEGYSGFEAGKIYLLKRALMPDHGRILLVCPTDQETGARIMTQEKGVNTVDLSPLFEPCIDLDIKSSIRRAQVAKHLRVLHHYREEKRPVTRYEWNKWVTKVVTARIRDTERT